MHYVVLKFIASSSKNVPKACTNVSRCVNEESSSNVERGWRRQCGCLRTSEKLKRLIEQFPSPQPPPPSPASPPQRFENTCISAYCTNLHQPALSEYFELIEKRSERLELLEATKTSNSTSWRVARDVARLIQAWVTATALAFYYIIYCYMQMVYYTLRSAIYFHNADGPMKITIGVVTLTSLVVGFNLILRLERLINFH